jgi:hypothetical protein
MTSPLDPTGEEAVERQVIAEEPRPGSWFGDDAADGRMLTQEQTDLRDPAHGYAMLVAVRDGCTVQVRIDRGELSTGSATWGRYLAALVRDLDRATFRRYLSALAEELDRPA